MTIQEWMADAIERAGRNLAYTIEQTQADRRDWRPHIEGAAGIRSALDMAGECIIVNRVIAHILRTGTPPTNTPFGPDAPRPFSDPDEAGPLLVESAKELGAAVRAMTDEDLAREFPSRRGPMPGAMLIEMPYRNMNYHSGQINLLQLLYGDTEFRMAPPDWQPKVSSSSSQ